MLQRQYGFIFDLHGHLQLDNFVLDMISIALHIVNGRAFSLFNLVQECSVFLLYHIDLLAHLFDSLVCLEKLLLHLIEFIRGCLEVFLTSL